MAAEHASSTFCNCKHLAPRWSSERWAYYRGKACPKKRTHVQRCAKQLSARLFPAMFQPVRFRRGPSSAWAELTLNHLNPHRGPSKWHWNWHWMHCNASSVILCQALFAWINTSWVSLGLCFKAKNRVTPPILTVWSSFSYHFLNETTIFGGIPTYRDKPCAIPNRQWSQVRSSRNGTARSGEADFCRCGTLTNVTNLRSFWYTSDAILYCKSYKGIQYIIYN